MKSKKSEVKKGERLESLDALRGFDMFWIVGGGALIVALANATQWEWLKIVADQMEHVPWQGFHFEDLIFPMFMFISGVAIPFAISSKVEQGAKRKPIFRKILRRTIILIVFGILYNGALQRGFTNLRYASVLGQIGIGYFFAATVFLYTRSFKTRLSWLLGILFFIAILQLWVPVPGYGAGVLDKVGGMNAWLDRMFLPGRLYGETFDPEGLLCCISAITVTLMGGLAGSFLRESERTGKDKAGFLVLSGAIGVVFALLLSTFYPIIKAAWTVPFNILTAGISTMLLSLFYYTIDVLTWEWRIVKYKVLFFKVIGMNSITIYMGTRIIDFGDISKFFTGWLAAPLGEWIVIFGAIVLEWLLLYFLYRRKIFLRV